MSVSVKTLWVSEAELKGIWEALHEYRFNNDDRSDNVENILIECGVAETRAEALFPEYTRLAVSLGKTGDSIPLKLTSEEFEFLANIPLTQDLKEILH